MSRKKVFSNIWIEDWRDVFSQSEKKKSVTIERSGRFAFSRPSPSRDNASVLAALKSLSSLTSRARVGTWKGSNLSAYSGSIGTQTRPGQKQGSTLRQPPDFASRMYTSSPVFGWTAKGDLSKWFIPLETFSSSLGYMKKKTISLMQV